MTAEGQVEFVNNQALEYFGKTLEELKGWATSEAVHPDDLLRQSRLEALGRNRGSL